MYIFILKEFRKGYYNMTANKEFYGWKLLVVVGLLFFCSSSFIMLTCSLIAPLMLKDTALGMTGKTLGLGFTVFILCQGLPAPLIGQFIGKYGQKRSFITGGLLIILGGLAMALVVSNPILYIIFFGVILSIGAIMAGQFTMQSSVSTWFVKKRALAMSIAMIFGSIGGFVAPYIVRAIIDSTGGSWHTPWFFISGLGVVVIILAALFVVNKPSDLGQSPDGLEDTGVVAKATKTSGVYKNLSAIQYKDALRNRNFWVMAIASGATFTGYALATSQGVIHFTTLGFEKMIITSAVSGMAVGNLLGKISIGPTGDRIEPSRMLGAYLAILTVAIFLAAKATTPSISYIYYFLTGFAFGGGSALMPVMFSNYFGNANFPKIWGSSMLVASIISGLVPIVCGAIYDSSKSLVNGFLMAAVITLIGAICCFLVRIPKDVK